MLRILLKKEIINNIDDITFKLKVYKNCQKYLQLSKILIKRIPL